MRFLGKYAKKCDSNKNKRNYAENGELCGVVRRTGKCAISHSPHLNVASDGQGKKIGPNKYHSISAIQSYIGRQTPSPGLLSDNSYSKFPVELDMKV